MDNANLKKTYTPGKGLTMLCRQGSSSLKQLEFGILELGPGDAFAYDTGENEAAFILLEGHCDVTGGGLALHAFGSRRNVFESNRAAAFYAGRRTRLTISTDWNVKIALCLAPASRDMKAFSVSPEQVRVARLGVKPWERDTSFLFDASTPTEHFCIGEAFVTPGNWAGFPPHKHDTEQMPAEGVLEELYYYLFQPSQGFGIQYVYTKDGSIDNAYPVRSNDLVEFPRGYHTTVGAPGYNFYFLWVMSGEHLGFFRSNDPDHDWVSAVENLIKKA